MSSRQRLVGLVFVVGLMANGEEMLYDLKKDPQENQNVAGNPEYSNTLKSMRKKLEKRMAMAESVELTQLGFDKVFFKHSNAPGHWNMNLDGKDIEPQVQKGGGRNYPFDLDADVSETTNLLSQYPEKAQALRAELEAWSQTLFDPGIPDRLPAQGNKYFDWYLDGKRDLPVVEVEDSAKRRPRAGKRKSKD